MLVLSAWTGDDISRAGILLRLSVAALGLPGTTGITVQVEKVRKESGKASFIRIFINMKWFIVVTFQMPVGEHLVVCIL